MQHLVIVESPAKCKTIQKYLGKDYRILASFGHVRDLPSKNGSVDPDADFAMHYDINNDSKKHVKAIVDAVKQSDSLYLATDPDREGEAISWHVLEILRQKKAIKKDFPVYRISFNEITKSAVTKAISQPRELDMNLINAQQARRALDYLVGFTLSPVLWRKLPGSRSAGRVQSVALRLICDREAEIEDFKSEEYWDIKGEFTQSNIKPFTARLTHYEQEKLERFSITNEKQATGIVDALGKKAYQVKSLTKKQVKRNPYAPFTTSSLQQEASRKCGFGAKKTMMVAQKLYEGMSIDGEEVGLITYMRTDGVTVSKEAIHASRQLIENEYGAAYVPKSPRLYSSKAKNAQEAHEAIRPTDLRRTPARMRQYLDKDQLKLYELIWKRMMASQMESAVMDQVVADITADDGKAVFRAVGTTIAFDGFLKLYMEGKDDAEDEEDDKILPPLKEGLQLDIKQLLPNQHFTQPPPRYSEASLVKKMEELGIGRPSTYASIISVLQDRHYVKLEQKRFFPEERGRIVTTFLHNFFKRYVEYDFTASLENELDQISNGDQEWKAILHKFWKDFIVTIEAAKEKDIGEILSTLEQVLEKHLFGAEEGQEIDKKCPKCDVGQLGLKLGKFGAFLACSNYPDCNYTRQIGDQGEGAGDISASEPKLLGTDSETGKEVLIKKGPYGFYVQLGEVEKGSKEKPKRSSIPKNYNPQELSFDQAMTLLSLPRLVGIHPETELEIRSNFGRFGPYLLHDGAYTSIKDDDPLTIGINRAVILIAEKAAKSKKAEPIRKLGNHPEEDQEINIYDGRYGPYIKYGRKNIKITKEFDPNNMTLKDAVGLIASQGASTKKKPTKKKAATTKKKTASKTTKKKATTTRKKKED